MDQSRVKAVSTRNGVRRRVARWRFSYVTATLLALAALPLKALAMGNAPPQTTVQQLGPYRFELPPGYVFRSYETEADSSGSFAFSALLPDLEPRTKANEAAFNVKGWGDVVTVWVSWRNQQASGAELLENIKRRITISQWFPPVKEEGFTRYRIEGGMYFRLYISENNPSVFFICSDPTPGYSPGCSRSELIAPDLVAYIEYSYNYRFKHQN